MSKDFMNDFFYISTKPFFLRFKTKINPSRPVAQWIQTWRKRLVRIHLHKKNILLCYLVYTYFNKFISTAPYQQCNTLQSVLFALSIWWSTIHLIFKVVYMSSEIFQWSFGSRDSSHAEKTNTVVTSWATHKMTTFLAAILF